MADRSERNRNRDRNRDNDRDWDYGDYESGQGRGRMSRSTNQGREWDDDYGMRGQQGGRGSSMRSRYSGSDYDQDRGYGRGGSGSGRYMGGREQSGRYDFDQEYGQGYSDMNYGRSSGDYGRGYNYDTMDDDFGGYGYSIEDTGSQGSTSGSRSQSGWQGRYERSDFGRGSRMGQSGRFGSQQQGEYYGRGPQGYQRSNQNIQEDINDRLTWDSHIDATHITVKVENGEVTLEGKVRDRAQKRHAEDIAEGVRGVHDVHNRLSVAANVFEQIGDAVKKALPGNNGDETEREGTGTGQRRGRGTSTTNRNN
jgi:osmotically-inducible protein OsmY